MNNTTSKAYGNLKPIEGKLLDNILEGNNDVYLTKKEDIINEIIKIVNNKSNKNIYIGIISDESAKRIFNDINLDVFNYKINLLNSGVKHWYRRHVLNESKTIPMKIYEIFDFIDVIDNYNKIIKIKSNDGYKITFTRKSDKGEEIAVSIVSSKKYRLSISTLYYKKKK